MLQLLPFFSKGSACHGRDRMVLPLQSVPVMVVISAYHH